MQPPERSDSVAAPRPSNHQVARAGRHYVAAELNRRGANDVLIREQKPRAEVTARSADRTRTIAVVVKTKTAGDWQPSTDEGRPRESEADPSRFWILVDLRRSAPSYYVMPEWWIENDIHDTHRAYLARHGGRRARHPRASTTESPTTVLISGASGGTS